MCKNGWRILLSYRINKNYGDEKKFSLIIFNIRGIITLKKETQTLESSTNFINLIMTILNIQREFLIKQIKLLSDSHLVLIW